MSPKTEMLDAMRNSDVPFVILVTVPGAPKPEVIVNPVDNLLAKIEYYEGAYNADLTHRFAVGVEIVGWEFLPLAVVKAWGAE